MYCGVPSNWPVSVSERHVRQPLGQAEIGDEPRVLGIDQHVGGLQIAVQHTVLVRMVHGPGHGQQSGNLGAGVARGCLASDVPSTNFIE